MNEERLERTFGAFEDRLVAFHEVQNVHTAVALATGVMRRARREPVATRFDELRLMQPGSLFAPAFAAGHLADLVDQP